MNDAGEEGEAGQRRVCQLFLKVKITKKELSDQRNHN